MSKLPLQRTLELNWADQIECRAIDWLWAPWLARGVIVVVDGDPGLGKSSLTMDLVARISAGRDFPSGELPPEQAPAAVRKPACSLVVALEDPIDSIVVPRLQAAGADLSRVAILGGVKEVHADGENVALLQMPRDLDLIAAKCREHRPALLVIDPFFAVLGYDEKGRHVKANDDQSVRRVTARLKQLAEELGATIVLVRHLNKAAGGSAIKRGSGSIAIAGQARTVVLVAAEPDNPDMRVLAMTKTNLTARPCSLRFRVVGQAGGSRIEWLGASDLTADQLIQSGPSEEARRSALSCAEFFLKTVLLEPGEHTWEHLTQEAAKEGISEITLRRLCAKLGLVTDYIGKHKSIWRLPQHLRLEAILKR